MTQPALDARSLAAMIAAALTELPEVSDRIGLQWGLRYATVTALNPLRGSYDGDDSDSDVLLISLGENVVVGARVAVLFIPPSGNYILKTIGSGAGALPKFAISDTNDTTTSGAYTTSGAPTVGVAFTAPPSGSVQIYWGGDLSNSAGTFTLLSPQVATGSVLGAGTVVLAAADANIARADTTALIRATNFHLLDSGLTPGGAYNCTIYHRVGGGTGNINRRRVMVIPSK